jgi:thiol:disulfide interchange protein
MARNDQRSIPIALLVIAALLLIARIVFQFTKAETPGRVQWVPPEKGITLARVTGKGVLFDFTADWCVPCHQLDAEVFADRKLAEEINKRFVAVRITDRQQEDGRNAPLVAELQRRYGVSGFPTVVFASPDGGELGRMEGYGGKRQFERVMEQVR